MDTPCCTAYLQRSTAQHYISRSHNKPTSISPQLDFYSTFFKTRSSSVVTLACKSTRSSLKIANCSFQYAAPYLWNQLPTELREPRHMQFPSRSPPITHGSSSSPSSLSPLSSSLTRSFFHSELKTWLFGKSFPPQTFLHLPN